MTIIEHSPSVRPSNQIKASKYRRKKYILSSYYGMDGIHINIPSCLYNLLRKAEGIIVIV